MNSINIKDQSVSLFHQFIGNLSAHKNSRTPRSRAKFFLSPTKQKRPALHVLPIINDLDEKTQTQHDNIKGIKEILLLLLKNSQKFSRVSFGLEQFNDTEKKADFILQICINKMSVTLEDWSFELYNSEGDTLIDGRNRMGYLKTDSMDNSQKNMLTKMEMESFVDNITRACETFHKICSVKEYSLPESKTNEIHNKIRYLKA